MRLEQRNLYLCVNRIRKEDNINEESHTIGHIV